MAATEAFDETRRGNRRQLIASALADEIARQGQAASPGATTVAEQLAAGTIFVEGTLDLEALADAVERVIGGKPGAQPNPPLEEGKAPQELNATNDD